MEKQADLIQKRLLDLSRLAQYRNIITYSDFLNLNELNLFHQIPKSNLITAYNVFGGYEYSERQMISFIPDALYYESNYPIMTLRIVPKMKKFSEVLTHRDYLGSILGLGIDRCKIGDILVEQDYAIVFVHEAMGDYIINHLTKVKNTFVEVIDSPEIVGNFEPKYQEIRGSVSSVRLDSILALVLPESRSKLIRYIEGSKIYVNGKLITTNAYKLQEGELISVRGVGKFQFVGIQNKTKKDRYFVTVRKFI